MLSGKRTVINPTASLQNFLGVKTDRKYFVSKEGSKLVSESHGKTSSIKYNSGRNEKLSEKDRRVLKSIVISKNPTTAAKVTAELNQHLDSPVSMITVRRHLHKQNIYGRAAIPKQLVTDVNAKRCLQWCHTHKTWSTDKWKKVIWFDKSSFTFFPTEGCTFGGHLHKRTILISFFQLSSMDVDLS
ncbi:transposable element Tc1 transposase [Trichonephila clavipes]|nr:transposable element Tc1 transposase [Trichonephila clavipes]